MNRFALLVAAPRLVAMGNRLFDGALGLLATARRADHAARPCGYRRSLRILLRPCAGRLAR